MSTIRKAITYAYPHSANARKLGMSDTGAWHVELTYLNIENSGQSLNFLPHNAEGFYMPDDPDLIALFREYEGDLCPHFVRHGNTKALQALGIQKEESRACK